MTRIITLLRHTKPLINPGICYGRLDVPLAPSQVEDMDQAIASLRPAQCIYSSPMLRCALLATRLSQRDQCALRLDDRLREIDFGQWEGQSWETIPQGLIDEWQSQLWSYAPGDGESLQQLWRRVSSFIEDIQSTGPQQLVIVSHHGPIRALYCQLHHRTMEAFFDLTLDYGHSVTVEMA
jgi:alpha-ribazole phosphatase